MTSELAVKSVENACINVSNTEIIILHNDLGSQYTSQEFENMIIEKSLFTQRCKILYVLPLLQIIFLKQLIQRI